MNVRIRFNAEIHTGAWFVDDFIVNNYAINLQLITQSHDAADHAICIGRVRAILDQLENTVFINGDHVDKIAQLSDCGFRVITFPQEPIDQIVGIVLYEKLNAVLENRMRVTDLDICSDSGDNIWFMHSEHEVITAVPKTNWWGDSTPSCLPSTQVSQEKKVVKLKKQISWKSLDLDWGSNAPSETVIINIKDDK
jgi:hypothetical protein